jgi:hypothetical protein
LYYYQSKSFFVKDFLQNGVYVSPLAGLKIIIRLTQGFAALTLGFYVASLQAASQFDIRQRECCTPSNNLRKISVYSVRSVVKKTTQNKNPCPSVFIRG